MYRRRVRTDQPVDDSGSEPDVVWPDPSPLSGWWQNVMFPESMPRPSSARRAHPI